MSSNTIRVVGCLLVIGLSIHNCWGQQPDSKAPRSVLRFDDASHVELINTKGLLRQKSPFTVELWFRAELGNEGRFPLIGDFVDRNHPNIQYPDRAGWLVGIGQTTKDTLSYGARFGGLETGGPLQVDEGTWCHIALASEEDGVSIYINGRRRHEKYPADQIKSKTSPINLHLGSSKYSPKIEGHQVDIADVRISSTCLYTDDFNPPIAFEKRPDTLVLLDFSHTNDKQITDLSGDDHHGTIDGAKWLSRDATSVVMPSHKVVFSGPLGIRRSSPGFVPRFARWEIKFSKASPQEYAQQLDFLQIELGMLSDDRQHVDYVSKLSDPAPVTRSAARENEKRVYLIRDEASVRKLDEPLLAKVGMEASDRVVMQFFSPEAENFLAVLEQAHGRKLERTVGDIVKTVFEIKPQGESWKLEVADMRFRSED